MTQPNSTRVEGPQFSAAPANPLYDGVTPNPFGRVGPDICGVTGTLEQPLYTDVKDFFNSLIGILQGDALAITSSSSSSLITSSLLRNCRSSVYGLTLHARQSLDFADDLALLSKTIQDALRRGLETRIHDQRGLNPGK